MTSTKRFAPNCAGPSRPRRTRKPPRVTLLDLTGLGAFTDYFLLCTGFSTPQVQAICDAIEEAPARARPAPRSPRRTRRRGMAAARLRQLHRARLHRAPAAILRSGAAVAAARRIDFTEPGAPDASAAGGRLA